jgi:hypothetical protein
VSFRPNLSHWCRYFLQGQELERRKPLNFNSICYWHRYCLNLNDDARPHLPSPTQQRGTKMGGVKDPCGHDGSQFTWEDPGNGQTYPEEHSHPAGLRQARAAEEVRVDAGKSARLPPRRSRPAAFDRLLQRDARLPVVETPQRGQPTARNRGSVGQNKGSLST